MWPYAASPSMARAVTNFPVDANAGGIVFMEHVTAANAYAVRVIVWSNAPAVFNVSDE